MIVNYRDKRTSDFAAGKTSRRVFRYRTYCSDAATTLGDLAYLSPEFWLNLRKLYELRLAGKKTGKGTLALPTFKSRIAACA